MKLNGTKLSQQKVHAKKDPKEHFATAFATQLAQAQAMVPHVPQPLTLAKVNGQGLHAHAPKRTELKAQLQPPQRPELPELSSATSAPSASRESSAQPQTLFILPETPRDGGSAKVEAPAPVWAPKELIADDTARLTLNPHNVNFINEGQQMSLQIKNGEVSIRAQGELAASLKSSEAELRIALAQEGLKLKDTDATQQQQSDDASSDQRRREQQSHTERDDEWT